MSDQLADDVAGVARQWVPDSRLGVFDVTVTSAGLAGCTTSREALTALRGLAADAGVAADIRLLPDGSVGDGAEALVTAAIAPLLREPRISADRGGGARRGAARCRTRLGAPLALRRAVSLGRADRVGG